MTDFIKIIKNKWTEEDRVGQSGGNFLTMNPGICECF